MKTKIIIFFLLLTTAISTTNAQQKEPYMPLLDTNKMWIEAMLMEFGYSSINDIGIGDIITYNNTLFFELFSEFYGTSPYYLREDTIERKVFYDPINAWGNISAMAISKSNSDVFYFSFYSRDANFNCGLFKITESTNDTIWTKISFGADYLNGDQSVKITEILIDASNENNVWITFGNFSDTNKVFQTTDGGENWQNISHNLPNIPVNIIAYDEQLYMLFIGSDVGVFYLSDVSEGSDTTWERYGDFTLVIASDIKINKTSRQLVVATYGRGVWRADIGCLHTGETIEIFDNQTWDYSKSIISDFILKQNGVLTISSDVYIASESKLIIDGGLWQGITVLGNSYLGQQTDNNQGVLEAQNGAVIENAINAIYVGNSNNPGDNNVGGIIRIDNATFRNNRTAVAMPKHQNFAFNDTNNYIKME